MKTKIFSLMLALMPLSSVCIDATAVPVTLTIIDPAGNQGEPHRGPVLVPEVGLENYILTFSTPCYGYTLLLLDGDGEEVYSTVVTSDTLVLPSTLEGEYEIMLIPTSGEIYFYGYVLF